MTDNNNVITLEYACINCDLDSVKKIHKIGFDHSKWSDLEHNPFYLAYINKHDDIVNYFINNGFSTRDFMYEKKYHFIFRVMRDFLVHKEQRYLDFIKSLYNWMTDPSVELYSDYYQDDDNDASFMEFYKFPYEVLRQHGYSDVPDVECSDTLKRLNDVFGNHPPPGYDRDIDDFTKKLLKESKFNPDNKKEEIIVEKKQEEQKNEVTLDELFQQSIEIDYNTKTLSEFKEHLKNKNYDKCDDIIEKQIDYRGRMDNLSGILYAELLKQEDYSDEKKFSDWLYENDSQIWMMFWVSLLKSNRVDIIEKLGKAFLNNEIYFEKLGIDESCLEKLNKRSPSLNGVFDDKYDIFREIHCVHGDIPGYKYDYKHKSYLNIPENLIDEYIDNSKYKQFETLSAVCKKTNKKLPGYESTYFHYSSFVKIPEDIVEQFIKENYTA